MGMLIQMSLAPQIQQRLVELARGYNPYGGKLGTPPGILMKYIITEWVEKFDINGTKYPDIPKEAYKY